MANNNNIFGLKNLPKNVAAANVPTANLLGLNEPVVEPAASPIRENLQSLFSPYEVGFFFDNDSKYIRQLSACASKIKSHKVAGRDYLMGTRIGSADYKNYMRNMSSAGEEFGEAIARLIYSQVPRGVRYEESIDFGSGIAPMDIAVLETWLEANTGKKMAVFIDYDRTLTQIEGGYMLGNSMEEMKYSLLQYGVPSETVTVDGFIEYYCGGTERVEMLQNMFDMIYSTPNVGVYILTNNPSCYKYVGLFSEVIHALTKGRPFHFLCSSLTGGNKKTAIQLGDSMVRGLCSAAGGRRGKKTRRHQKKRKMTRHH